MLKPTEFCTSVFVINLSISSYFFFVYQHICLIGVIVTIVDLLQMKPVYRLPLLIMNDLDVGKPFFSALRKAAKTFQTDF